MSRDLHDLHVVTQLRQTGPFGLFETSNSCLGTVPPDVPDWSHRPDDEQLGQLYTILIRLRGTHEKNHMYMMMLAQFNSLGPAANYF